MKIDKIKKNGSRYKLYLDDGTVINTFDEVIIKYNLLFNKELDLNMISKIHLDNSYYDAYNKVLKLIDRRLRSSYEIEKYLKKNNVENYHTIIASLKEKGFINDERFTKAFISDKIHLSNEGKGKIKKELLNHNIDEEIINRELEQIKDENMEEKVDKIIAKKIAANRKDSSFILKQKISNYLFNLGYDKSFINSRMNYFDFNNCDIEKEMDKIYNKLSSKYEGNELINKLKQKLYSRGFKTEEINNYINKKSSID